jgi:hypothetical protein
MLEKIQLILQDILKSDKDQFLIQFLLLNWFSDLKF